MKSQIHPKFYEQAQVICACGNTFTTGSTIETIRIELCNKCHPFYTGEQRFVDTGSVIQRFQEKMEKAKEHKAKKAEKIENKRQQDSSPKSLREMLLGVK